jgi:hypothetical protein
MSKIKSPQQKKQMAYERDHYAKSEYDKARNAWRTKKQKARRSYRHAADSLRRPQHLMESPTRRFQQFSSGVSADGAFHHCVSASHISWIVVFPTLERRRRGGWTTDCTDDTDMRREHTECFDEPENKAHCAIMGTNSTANLRLNAC